VALRFFADHCISNQIVNALRSAEHEVLRLKDHMPAESDPAVIAKAQELGAILLSLMTILPVLLLSCPTICLAPGD
jgi:hypothetical protein